MYKKKKILYFASLEMAEKIFLKHNRSDMGFSVIYGLSLLRKKRDIKIYTFLV